MIGTTKLSEIRKTLEEALGPDPIAELDRQIASAKRRGERTEVVEGLKRFLQRGPKRKVEKQTANHKLTDEGKHVMDELERFVQRARSYLRRKRRPSAKK